TGLTVYATIADETASGKPGCSNVHYDKGTTHLGEGYVLSHAMRERQKTCLERWPPFVPSENAKPAGKWTVVSRAEGFKQWAYEGRPLYTSIKDKSAGEVNGILTGGGGRGGAWHTV